MRRGNDLLLVAMILCLMVFLPAFAQAGEATYAFNAGDVDISVSLPERILPYTRELGANSPLLAATGASESDMLSYMQALKSYLVGADVSTEDQLWINAQTLALFAGEYSFDKPIPDALLDGYWAGLAVQGTHGTYQAGDTVFHTYESSDQLKFRTVLGVCEVTIRFQPVDGSVDEDDWALVRRIADGARITPATGEPVTGEEPARSEGGPSYLAEIGMRVEWPGASFVMTADGMQDPINMATLYKDMVEQLRSMIDSGRYDAVCVSAHPASTIVLTATPLSSSVTDAFNTEDDLLDFVGKFYADGMNGDDSMDVTVRDLPCKNGRFVSVTMAQRADPGTRLQTYVGVHRNRTILISVYPTGGSLTDELIDFGDSIVSSVEFD